MNFVTLEFAVFFFFVLAGTWLLQSKASLYRGFLLLTNLFFYAVGGKIFLPLLLFVSILIWGTGVLLARASLQARRKTLLICGVACSLAVLGLFKYYEFFITSIEDLLSLAGITWHMPVFIADLAFPMGISFYTFQGIAYLVEQYRHPEEKPQTFLRVLMYLSFFPTVLAGPILRPGQFFPQLEQAPAREINIQEGAALILSGLFKKVVLASYLSEQVVGDVFQTPELFSSWAVLIGVYGYSIQIFCDFSGYTDLAMGIGRLMGFRLPQNFNAPYLSLNLQEFWRRWHITLSLWLRDYLYIPLGGSRKGNRYVNLMLTMLLGGLWHGAHARFLVWGALHGAGLVVVHAWQACKGKMLPKQTEPIPEGVVTPSRLLAWFLTFHFVTLTWIFFRAEDMPTAQLILERIFDWGQAGEGFAFMAIPAIIAGLAVQWFGPSLYRMFLRAQALIPWPAQAVVAALLAGMILRMGPDGVLPFIYFQF